MEINVPQGKYVLAVSGGVDSMVLLDLLSKMPGIGLVVGHFNHGIRPDSAKDEELVAFRAHELKLPFKVGYGHLGQNASEAQARRARYLFLESVRRQSRAKSIITAHHQDDLIETAILNLLRGTGHRGLVAISANRRVARPLLAVSKDQVLDYAETHQLKWREDPSNKEDIYLRNYIRRNLMQGLAARERGELISNIDKVANKNESIIKNIAKVSQYIYERQTINRQKFIDLPVDLGNELIVFWLHKLSAADFDRQTINRLNITLRTAKAGTIHPIKGSLNIKIKQKTAEFNYTL